jgi:hypothetical protein
MKAACFGRKPLPAGTLASNGDKMACVVDQVVQFAAELEGPGADAEERRVARARRRKSSPSISLCKRWSASKPATPSAPVTS